MLLLAFTLLSAGLAYLLNRILIRYSKQLRNGEASREDGVRWGSRSKPVVGGITFFVLFLIGLLASTIAQPEADNLSLGSILSVGIVAFLIGLSDDAYNTRPLLKFGGQVFCGVLLVVFGDGISLFGTPWADVPLTLLWVVGIMNSYNMLDNMDGVSGATALSVFISAAVFMGMSGATAGLIWPMSFVMIGALLGFLWLNWKPSKLYMGDTGSQLLGAFLAYVGIKVFWNASDLNGAYHYSEQLILPVLVFGMMILDTTIVVIARIRRGQSPFVGGRDHTTHGLVYFGLRESRVPVVFLLGGLLLGGLGIYAVWQSATWELDTAIYLASLYLAVLGGFTWMYRMGQGRAQQSAAKTGLANAKEHFASKLPKAKSSTKEPAPAA